MIRIIRETHEAPASMQELLTRAAGRNWYGEPMYRFIWGSNRTELVGGKWTDYSPTGSVLRERFEMRRVLKYTLPYFNENRWYIERWYPPEHFGARRLWTERTIEMDGFQAIEALGPFPSRGDYKHFYTVENKHQEFVQLTWPRALWLASVAWSSERAHKKTLQQERDRLAAKEAEQSKRDLEALEDTIPAFNYQPTVTVL